VISFCGISAAYASENFLHTFAAFGSLGRTDLIGRRKSANLSAPTDG
jgi:hypothetical protein